MTNGDSRQLRRWLSKTPQPHHLRVDGNTLRLEGGRGRWAEAEKSLSAMQAKCVEAIGPDEGILRVIELEDTDAAKATTQGQTELVLVGKLLKEAMEAGSKANAEAYKASFETLSKLTTTLAKRLTTMEGRYQRLYDQTTMDDENDLDGLAGHVIASALQGRQPAPPQPNPNGKPKK